MLNGSPLVSGEEGFGVNAMLNTLTRYGAALHGIRFTPADTWYVRPCRFHSLSAPHRSNGIGNGSV